MLSYFGGKRDPDQPCCQTPLCLCLHPQAHASSLSEMVCMQLAVLSPTDCGVQARAAARENESDTPVVPITVRQLEAVVRISESYARMQLQVSHRTPQTLRPARH